MANIVNDAAVLLVKLCKQNAHSPAFQEALATLAIINPGQFVDLLTVTAHPDLRRINDNGLAPWKKAAMSGQKIDAIKEFRRIADHSTCGLLEAKNSVEAYLCNRYFIEPEAWWQQGHAGWKG